MPTPRARALIQQLEVAILDNAMGKAHAQSHGKVASVSTTCVRPVGAGAQNVSDTTAAYDCTAFVRGTRNGSRSSYRYTGTIDTRSGKIAWHFVGAA